MNLPHQLVCLRMFHDSRFLARQKPSTSRRYANFNLFPIAIGISFAQLLLEQEELI
jgi:hypothetical protein